MNLGAISILVGLVALAFSAPLVGVPILGGALWLMFGKGRG